MKVLFMSDVHSFSELQSPRMNRKSVIPIKDFREQHMKLQFLLLQVNANQCNLASIKYVDLRRQAILVLCIKILSLALRDSIMAKI